MNNETNSINNPVPVEESTNVSFCSSCGTPLNAEQIFCPSCGAKNQAIKSESTQQPAPVIAKEPATEIAQEPATEVLQEDTPEIVEESAPEIIKEPAPDIIEETAPVVAQQPTAEDTQESASVNLCANCGYAIPTDSKFCPSCGASATDGKNTKSFCRICGNELFDNENFCRNCGTPSAAQYDNMAQNNINAYNNNLQYGYVGVNMMQKAPKLPLKVKKQSVFSIISFLLMALGASISLGYCVTNSIWRFITFDFNLTLLIINAVSYAMLVAAAILGLFIWHKEKKFARSIPIILIILSILTNLNASAFSLVIEYLKPIMLLLLCVPLLLLSLGVIKKRGTLLNITIPLFSLNIIICIVSYFSLPFMTALVSIALFLLCFTYTNKETEQKEPKKATKVITHLVSIVLIILMLVSIPFAMYSSQYVFIKSDMGANYDDVCAKYEYDLNISKKEVFSDTVEKGCIVSHEINYYKTYGYQELSYFIPKRTDVTFFVSKGPGVKVPDMKDKPYKEAKKELEDLGLTVEIEKEYHYNIKKDHVILVTPERVDEGATVTLRVSKGKDPRKEVPDVIGYSLSEAKSKLQKAGFKVKVKYTYGDGVDVYEPEETVSNYSPSENSKPGTTITITVPKPSISMDVKDLSHNSVGGVDVAIYIKNLSNKTIKYVTFETHYTNTFGDDAPCTIQDTSYMNLEYTGPISPGGSDTPYWDAVIYNYDAEQIHFDNILVEFTDGSSQSLYCYGYWYM